MKTIKKCCLAMLLALSVTSSSEALEPQLKERISHLVKNNPFQLSVAEYSMIAEAILEKGSCNMLVFGVGNDSGLWIDLNKTGLTVFLEDNRGWLDHVSAQQPDINAHIVTYNTKRHQWQELLNSDPEQALRLELPREIVETKWDIIFVDAPEGMSDNKPGRMKSIYTAAQLAHQSGDCLVFVHDCNRIVEAVYSTTFLHDKNLVLFKDRLRCYYIPEGS